MILIQMSEERNETKAVSRSVTMPESLWDATDSHAASDPISGDRSSYIRRLVTADLEASGKLPGSAQEQALTKSRAMIDLLGPQRAVEVFERELAAAACSAASKGARAA